MESTAPVHRPARPRVAHRRRLAEPRRHRSPAGWAARVGPSLGTAGRARELRPGPSTAALERGLGRALALRQGRPADDDGAHAYLRPAAAVTAATVRGGEPNTRAQRARPGSQRPRLAAPVTLLALRSPSRPWEPQDARGVPATACAKRAIAFRNVTRLVRRGCVTLAARCVSAVCSLVVCGDDPLGGGGGGGGRFTVEPRFPRPPIGRRLTASSMRAGDAHRASVGRRAPVSCGSRSWFGKGGSSPGRHDSPACAPRAEPDGRSTETKRSASRGVTTVSVNPTLARGSSRTELGDHRETSHCYRARVCGHACVGTNA